MLIISIVVEVLLNYLKNRKLYDIFDIVIIIQNMAMNIAITQMYYEKIQIIKTQEEPKINKIIFNEIFAIFFNLYFIILIQDWKKKTFLILNFWVVAVVYFHDFNDKNFILLNCLILLFIVNICKRFKTNENLLTEYL